MMDSAPEGQERRRARLARVGTIEGYAAFVILLICIVPPSFTPRIPEPYGLAIGITLWALAWIFSLSGTRFGKGGGRIAGGFTLTLLILHAVAILVIGLH
jgi:hypothetical protein